MPCSRLLLVVGLLCSFAVACTAESPRHDDHDRSASLVASTGTFEFYSDFWMNLHDYLYWRAQDDGPSDLPTTCLDEHSETQRAAWQAAEAFYQTDMGQRHHRRDSIMVGLRYHFSDLPNDVALPETLRPIVARLEAAAPVYETCWWPEHDARNRDWIAWLAPRLEEHQDTMTARISRYYQSDWRGTMPIDVVSYASWAGANTLGTPDHIMMSSIDEGYTEWLGFEMVIHEASHTMMGSGYGKTDTYLAEFSQAYGKNPPNSLWHAILFYTSGRVAQQVLADQGIDHTMYMYRWGVFERFFPYLEAHWEPYIEHEVDLRTAASTIIDGIYGTAAAR